MMRPEERERAAVLFIREVCADLAQHASKLSRHGADYKTCELEDLAFIRRAADRIERAMKDRDKAKNSAGE